MGRVSWAIMVLAGFSGAGFGACDGMSPVLWREPEDSGSRNLFYGPGGAEDQPGTKFTFVEEDLSGTNPKIVVRDRDQVKWTVKMGPEARPETAATRLIWGAGYFANEDYFASHISVEGLPARLRRGQKWVTAGDTLRDVRLKRHLKNEKKVGNWEWSRNPFSGTRELNGLRVLMALLNNWDLTGENNGIYRSGAEGKCIYMVSDVGSTFGTGNLTWSMSRARGNLQTYSHSKFPTKIAEEYVDFHTPARPSFFFVFTPREYLNKLKLRWIGKHIPKADARWIGSELGRLSPQQIRDAFRAAGYPPQEVEGFATLVERRIALLQEL